MVAFLLMMIFFANMCLLIALIMHVEEKGNARKKSTKKRKVGAKREKDWEMISDEDFDQITNSHILDFMEEERYESKSRNKEES
tara:strand:+ start:994 stop:1245 length:252 start_codon:yes stop_codon:yes gene_type:complete